MSISNHDNISNEPIVKDFFLPHKKSIKKNKKLNPLANQGKVSRCVICNSKMHRAKIANINARPQNANIVDTSEEETDGEYEVEDVNFVLMTTKNPRWDLVEEMITKAVIDTASTKTAAAQLWLQNYMKNLDITSFNQVEISKCQNVFKFGDGRKVIVTSEAKLPAQI